MKCCSKFIFLQIVVALFFSSCSILEKASTHGFDSGLYELASESKNTRKVYADVSDEKIDLYNETEKLVVGDKILTIPLKSSDSTVASPLVFRKKSLDIDVTSILLKYRPSVHGLPGQLTTDFNIALYAGWRHDNYIIKVKGDPLGKHYHKISNWGYDFGFFSGPGGTLISPFTTQNHRTDEYSGLIIQSGFAGFLESNIASFGISIGIDYLMNSDRNVWIYTNKPWIGFIVGIAIN